MAKSKAITVLGIFVADTTFRADRQPRRGETVLGNSFALGPGGKGSNQAVACARLGGDVTLITRLGDDAFADLAEKTWDGAGVKRAITRDGSSYTGAACVMIEEATGNNAIIVSPGAASRISINDINQNADLIRDSAIFLTQLEQPIDAAVHALQIARQAGVTTILNPAPASPLADIVLALCDYITPNETEAEDITGLRISSVEEARLAGDILLSKGVGCAIITLGKNGALIHSGKLSVHIPAFKAGEVVETTGAGDAFNGGFAVGLADGLDPLEAARMGCATAGMSVTRPGAAASMPTMEEVRALLK